MRRWQNKAFADLKPLFRAQTTLGWSVARNISDADGRRGVASGSMREVFDEITHLCIGYQMLAVSEQRGDQDLPSVTSTASISRFEMEVNAGLLGRSRTAGLTEAQRLERAAQRDERSGEYLTPEDVVERVQAKVLIFPHIGAERGDILRVLPL